MINKSSLDAPEAKIPKLLNHVEKPLARIGARDLEASEKAITLRAIREYEARVVSINAFPDAKTKIMWAKKCWKNANQDASATFSLTPSVQGIVCIT